MDFIFVFLRRIFKVVFLGGFLLNFAQAQTPALSSQNENELNIKKIAKKRLYPGGVDESDLLVQQEIIKPLRKEIPEIAETKSTNEPEALEEE